MKTLTLVPALLLMIMATTAIARGGDPIVNYPDQTYSRFDNRKLSKDEVGEIIRQAAIKQDWRVSPGEQPDSIIATLIVRSHTAVVKITYDENKYSLFYKDSNNLNWAKNDPQKPIIVGSTIRPSVSDTIHPNYNKWVSYLNNEIANQLSNSVPAKQSTSSGTDEVEQLEKLKKLKDRGLISADEYESKKKEILNRM